MIIIFVRSVIGNMLYTHVLLLKRDLAAVSSRGDLRKDKEYRFIYDRIISMINM